MEEKHTPTPYWVAPYVDAIDIVAEDGTIIAHMADRDLDDTEPPDDAAFIVRACNSHDDLLTACQTANRYLADMANNGGPKPGMAGITEWSEVQSSLSAAIAKALPTT